MRRKRELALLLTVILCGSSLAGCHTNQEKKALPEGAAENDIIAYQPVEKDKMMITARTEYNGVPSNLESIIEEQFPEVDFVPRLHSAAAGREFEECLKHDDLEDMFFTWEVNAIQDDRLKEHLADLSSKSFVTNYYTTALNACEYDGRLYYLPGPSKVAGIVYDKTLFEKYGWEIPSGLDEFIALCQTIQKDTGMQPVDFTFKYPSGLSTIMNAWGYGAVLAGNDNYEWLQEYAEGKTSMIGHMEPMFALFQKLVDSGVITQGAFTREPGDRSTALYVEHTTAMTNETQMAPIYAQDAGSNHEYGMLPLWGDNSPDSDYVSVESTYNIAVNKNLEKQENKEKYDKVMEIMEWLSSAEGQQALIGSQGMAVSNVKDVPLKSTDFTSEVEATIQKGHLVPETYYSRRTDSKEFYATMREGFWNIARGTQTAEEVMQDCDAKIQELLREKEETAETVYGTASESFSRLETGLYIADAFRRIADTDVAIVLTGQSNYGTLSRIYQGDMTETAIKSIGLDSFAGENEDYNKLAVAEMTGEQILEILEASFSDNPKNQDRCTCYVASGLKVEYAPWAAQGEHLISVKNEDGSEFDVDKTYSVSYWNGSFSNEKSWNNKDSAEIIADIHPEKLYEESFFELMAPIVQEDGEIAPFQDDRLVLNWDITAEDK